MLTMTKMTERRAALFSVLRGNAGQWMTRTELAAATGKTRLSPNDVHHLEDLAREGLIEARQETIKSPLGYEWQYRAIGE